MSRRVDRAARLYAARAALIDLVVPYQRRARGERADLVNGARCVEIRNAIEALEDAAIKFGEHWPGRRPVARPHP